MKLLCRFIGHRWRTKIIVRNIERPHYDQRMEWHCSRCGWHDPAMDITESIR